MYTSEATIFQIVTRILCDHIPHPSVDAVCIFGETVENEFSMLEIAQQLQMTGVARLIAVTGFEGTDVKPQGEVKVSGFETLKKKLMGLGVSSENIVSFPLSDKFPPCTDAEATGLVEFAKSQGWRSICVTVPPLHQVRAFISAVSAAIKYYPELRVYSWPGTVLPWTEKVMHSQSAPRARRCDQFGGELAKIEKYRDKGDHATPEELLTYLDRRDE